jgi:hypothetical protein
MVPIGFRALYSRGKSKPIGLQEVEMPQVMVRYRVHPDRVTENEQLIRTVYEELATSQPSGLHYATFKLPDGVTFVHVARHGEPNPLASTGAFQRFQEGIRDRCDEPPSVVELDQVGSYRFFEDER